MKRKTLNNELLERFEHYLRSEEKSKATVAKYMRDVTMLRNYAAKKRLSKDILIGFKEDLFRRGYKVSSINSIISSVNCLLDFMDLGEYRLKNMKVQKKLFSSEEAELTLEEYQRLLEVAEKHKKKKLWLVMQTICSTGIRVSELRYITVDAVKHGQATVRLKGKTRDIIIVNSLRERIMEYAEEAGIEEGPVFLGSKGEPLERNSVWRGMKRLCLEAGVNPEKVYPHNLRHLFARALYDSDKDLAKLADILGHSSVDTTRIYIVSTGSAHRQLMENLHLVP